MTLITSLTELCLLPQLISLSIRATVESSGDPASSFSSYHGDNSCMCTLCRCDRGQEEIRFTRTPPTTTDPIHRINWRADNQPKCELWMDGWTSEFMSDEESVVKTDFNLMRGALTPSQYKYSWCVLPCRAPVDDVVAWGESLDQLLECKSESTHRFIPLSLLSNAALSILRPFLICLFALPILRRSASLYHLRLASGFPTSLENIFFPSSSSNPFGDIFKGDYTGRDKRPNLSCRCRYGDSSWLEFIHKGSWRWCWLVASTWPYHKQLGGADGFFLSHFLLSFFSHYFAEMDPADL